MPEKDDLSNKYKENDQFNRGDLSCQVGDLGIFLVILGVKRKMNIVGLGDFDFFAINKSEKIKIKKSQKTESNAWKIYETLHDNWYCNWPLWTISVKTRFGDSVILAGLNKQFEKLKPSKMAKQSQMLENLKHDTGIVIDHFE